MGRRHYRKKRPQIKYFRVNQYIKVPKVKLIDPDEGLIGVVNTREALARAQEKKLDLVEVSPKENPPVAKIIDYGRFKYNLEKKKQKAKNKKTSNKGIRLTLNMAAHDLETRTKQANKFIGQGHNIQIELTLRGRQMAHVKRAFEQINNFIKPLQETVAILQYPIKKGRRITALLQAKKQ